MSGGADWSRTCEGCAYVVNEAGPKDELWARCFAPGRCEGYVVGNGHFLPYVPAWCPLMQEKEAALMIGKQVTLESIPEGTAFQVFGDWFVALERVDSGILSLRRDIWERGIPDGDDRNDAHTDGVSRSLKRYREFLISAGMPEKEACETLLNQTQYHRNQHLIPPLDEADPWWLEQREKIPDKKCGNVVKGRMLFEYGTCVKYIQVFYAYGVRPAVIFNPSTVISLVQEQRT